MKKFFGDNKSIGLVLFICTALSLALANSAVSSNYFAFWNNHFFHTDLLPASLLHIINEGLMSVFFFFAALEIKRELISGELNSLKRSLMPLISATGGMIIPALVYLVFCHSKDNYMGWGIPMATDIAFSLAILSLLGNRVSLSLRIFLTALAIIDDVGGIIAITFFYPGHLQVVFLVAALGIMLLLALFNYRRSVNLYIYIPLGVILWFLVFNSGISPTIAGVIVAFTIPSSLIHRLMNQLHIPVNFGILPLFALANTAIAIPADIIGVIASPVHIGVFMGLFLGKPAGIYLFAKAASFLKIAELPKGINGKQLLSVGMIAGIGFTVSLFITALAFTDEGSRISARLAVITGSLLSGVIGYFMLRYSTKK